MHPPPVTVVNAGGRSPVVLICEHASNHIPDSHAGLGLDPADLLRHIAWDIGAAALARRLSALLDAPLFLSGYSRLLIDCNRPPGAATSIPLRSEDTLIPGNQALSRDEITRREAAYFAPFQDRIAGFLDARVAAGQRTTILGVHSFTPVFRGVRRSWHAGVLYRDATTLGARLRDALRADPALVVGDNEPYRIALDEDYTVPVHGDQRGIPAALIEVRQDLLATGDGVEAWADRLAAILGHADMP
ncbi:N-formylglutamate amidohydrolase [Elioraea sp.]|uniref:N-formylglutamate amidohydrolase n=1 Tax=Elioraea sp. TaxID=2185103 RepID=UPI0025C1FBEC|nr:N-formylglutamate amidohydrolase [Elioraea sp.]